ncbi:uncharacterized protein LOC108883579 isoform X2 [Lates calcarifer]|uniref:Uncharacterized protein LOC108883579 isoform X1 n=1 Tax=Lates calcarifer TaxID=8187 RepID=A0AAJ7PMG7_LATCA|nr:uncharacterized protein LOC108883579 isoform X1 [Lates calcarifer]XP_050931436.1 uncharacterized protein LOC108883579 isoform X2 [Lates calcarifer]
MGHTLFCVLGLFMLDTLLCYGFCKDADGPNVTVSASWLSPGASVTLTCEVKPASKGWKFFWSKVVPKLSNGFYDRELLPGDSNGTEGNSFVVPGQTHTAGYSCRAGRDPLNYTPYSRPKFVWSRDVSALPSIKVNPAREPYFTNESISLSCEGNSTEWRVMRFTEGGYPSNCSNWGIMTGSTCKLTKFRKKAAVYWCESGSGQFSNAVNITVQYVPESSSFPVLTVGLVCGISVIIFLLMLFCWRKSKDPCFVRTSRGSAPDHMVNKNETEPNPTHLYDDVRLSESFKGHSNTGTDESQGVTYSVISLENIREKVNPGKSHGPEDCSIYYNIKFRSAAGKSAPAAMEETFYSQVQL